MSHSSVPSVMVIRGASSSGLGTDTDPQANTGQNPGNPTEKGEEGLEEPEGPTESTNQDS